MCVRLWLHGSRGSVELAVGRAVRLRAHDPEVQACAPPDCAADERCAALVATDVVTGAADEGVWQ